MTISFGGSVGTYLQASCPDVPSLKFAIQSVIDAYGIKSLDFDIEGANLTNRGQITRLATALSELQLDEPGLIISLTLPVLPQGLTSDGLNVVSTFFGTRHA